MYNARYSLATQSHGTARLRLSRAERFFRYLGSLCRKQIRSTSDPAPGSYFRAYRERQEQSNSLPSPVEHNKPRPPPLDFSPPDFRPFEVDLQSMMGLDDFDELWKPQEEDTGQPGQAESEKQKISDLQSYQFGQVNESRPEKEEEAVSPTSVADVETNVELESQRYLFLELSRKDSLLANLQCLQSRISATEEKLTLSLAELADNTVLREHIQEPKRTSDTSRRETPEQGKENYVPSLPIHLAHLNNKIKSLMVLLEDPKTEPQLAFFTNAWLVVHQMNQVESSAKGLLSDMESNGSWYGKGNLTIQSTAGLPHRLPADLAEVAKEMVPRCERLSSRLESLALEAKMPSPPRVKIVICPCCGQDTPERRVSN